MAEKRRLVPDPIVYQRQGDTTILRPQAGPVDTFERAAEPVKSDLHGLTAALAQFHPKLERYADQKIHEQAVADAREAEAKAMVSTAQSWDDAIAKGEAPAGASPLYRRVYEETLGKLSGLNKAQATLWQEWVAPDNKDRTTQDPEVIARWFAERRAKFFEGKSQDWVKGFAPSFAQVQQQLTQKIISDNVKAIEQGNHDALGQLFMERIQAGAVAGQSPAQIAAQLASDAIPHRFVGMQGKEINTIAAKAIVAVAQKTGRTDLLQVGYADRPDIKNPGQTIKGVFTIPEFAMMADNAQTSILAKANQAESRAQLAEARAEKRMHKDMLGELVEKRAADPNWEPDVEWKKRWAKTGGSMNMLRSELNASTKPLNDPAAFNSMAERYVDLLRSGQDASRAIEAMAPHLPYGTILQLHKENDKGESSVFRSRVYGVQDDALKGMVDRLTKNLDPLGAADVVRKARTELAQFALEQQRSMSSAGHVDSTKLEDAIVKKTEELVRRMQEADSNIGTPQPKPGEKPKADQQQPKPQQPTNSVPANNTLAPVRPDAVGHQWPEAQQTNADGRVILRQWELPAGVQPPDMQDVNLLRSNPWIANKDGVPLWQRFDQVYGKGATRFFMTNGPMEIGIHLDRMNKTRRDAKTSVDKAIKETPKPSNAQ